MSQHTPSFPFPANQFYETVELAFDEVMDAIQSPDALIASSFLTAMSVACQADIDMMLPIGQTTPCALFLATIADSGERKTATDNLVLKPIYEYELAKTKAYDIAAAKYKADHRYWSTTQKALDRMLAKSVFNEPHELRERYDACMAAEPSKPELNRIVLKNTTERALINAMRGRSKSIAILTDEGATFVRSGAARGLGTLNKVWDGPSIASLDVAEEIIEVYDPRLTLSFMIQKDPFSAFLDKPNNMARASGFLARFLLCHPESTQGHRVTKNRLEDGNSRHPALDVFHSRITQLLHERDTRHAAGDRSKKALRFSPDAKARWVEAQNQIELQIGKGGTYEDIRDFASKSVEIASRVAGILHHFEGLEGDVVERATLERALSVVAFYFREFQEKFGSHNNLPEDEKDAWALKSYLRSRYWERNYNQAPRNDLRKNGPIRHQGRFCAALLLLEADGVIRIERENYLRGSGRQLIH
ncbi:YfjI family protein, partial [Stutzerimonas nitrititolerans]|uniref:YfjI family protein n=1 Tax=Stutzerimonas nitrititolerans TaxID=2482751 RepID=UPI0028A0CA12